MPRAPGDDHRAPGIRPWARAAPTEQPRTCQTGIALRGRTERSGNPSDRRALASRPLRVMMSTWTTLANGLTQRSSRVTGMLSAPCCTRICTGRTATARPSAAEARCWPCSNKPPKPRPRLRHGPSSCGTGRYTAGAPDHRSICPRHVRTSTVGRTDRSYLDLWSSHVGPAEGNRCSRQIREVSMNYWCQSTSSYHVTMMACSPATASIVVRVSLLAGRAGYSRLPAMPVQSPASISSMAVSR
jgi:hypothetical protein